MAAEWWWSEGVVQLKGVRGTLCLVIKTLHFISAILIDTFTFLMLKYPNQQHIIFIQSGENATITF